MKVRHTPMLSCLITDWKLIELPLLQDILIQKKYRVVRKVATGSWSAVYIGTRLAPKAKDGHETDCKRDRCRVRQRGGNQA